MAHVTQVHASHSTYLHKSYCMQVYQSLYTAYQSQYITTQVIVHKCTSHRTYAYKSLYRYTLHGSEQVTVQKCSSHCTQVHITMQKCNRHCTEVYHSLYRSALLCSVFVHKHALYTSAPVMVPVTMHRIKTRWTSLQRRLITYNNAFSREADNTPSMTVYKTALYGKKTRTRPYSLSDS